MTKVLPTFLILLTTFGIDGNYTVSGRKIVNKRSGYELQVPKHWHVLTGAPAPLLFTYDVDALKHNTDGVPDGGADLSITDDAGAHRAGSLEAWAKIDESIDGYSSITDSNPYNNPAISQAIQVISFYDAGDSLRERITQVTAVYFKLGDHLLGVYLRYNANDKRAKIFDQMLVQTLHSFRFVEPD